MNFSPDNRTTLETLLGALQGGLNAGSVAPIFDATMQAQMAAQQARQQRYQEMATNVANLAMQGQTYGAASNYVDTMTQQPGIPGKFQGLIDSAYAHAQMPPSLEPTGGFQEPTAGGGMTPTAPPPRVQNQLQSPMYTENPANTGVHNMNPINAQGQPNPSYGNLMTASGQQNYAANQAMMANQPAPPSMTESDKLGDAMSGTNQLILMGWTPEKIAEQIKTDPIHYGVIVNNIMVYAQTYPEIAALLAPDAGIG